MVDALRIARSPATWVTALFGCTPGPVELDLPPGASAIAVWVEGPERGAYAVETSVWKHEVPPGASFGVLKYDQSLAEIGIEAGEIEVSDEGAPFPDPVATYVLDSSENLVSAQLPDELARLQRHLASDPCDFPEVEILDTQDPLFVVPSRLGAFVMTSTGPFHLVDGSNTRDLPAPAGVPREAATYHVETDTVWMIDRDGRLMSWSEDEFQTQPAAEPLQRIFGFEASHSGPFALYVLDQSLEVRQFDGAWTSMYPGGELQGGSGRSLAWVAPGEVWVAGPSATDLVVVGGEEVVLRPFVGTVSLRTEGEIEELWHRPNTPVAVAVDENVIYVQTPSGWRSYLSNIEPSSLVFLRESLFVIGSAGSVLAVTTIGTGTDCPPRTFFDRDDSNVSVAVVGEEIYVAGALRGERKLARLYWKRPKGT